MKLTANQSEFVKAARAAFGMGPDVEFVLTRVQVLQVAKDAGLKDPQWLMNDDTLRHGRGLYRIPSLPSQAASEASRAATPTVTTAALATSSGTAQTGSVGTMEMSFGTGGESLIPSRMSGYVPFGAHWDIVKIFKSGRFFPIYMTGLSGNGKTTIFEQAAAEAGREFFRVNITPETGEDDLLGGLRLINGNTVWADGPVVCAMKRGAVLLLDEVDLGTTKIMCLQPVLEGKPVFVKKISQWIHPKKGFTIALTGNTKGRGDESGRFIGTNVMNEAFLDRIPYMVEHTYPSNEVEEEILNKVLASGGVKDPQFTKNMVRWADTNRKAYSSGEDTEIITTRRLIQAMEDYVIFGDRLRAVNDVLTRFDETFRQGLLTLYKKIDATVDGGVNAEPLGEAPKAPIGNEPPF